MKLKGLAPLEVITPNDEYHYFFGYYDLQPYDLKGKRHLAHRVKFADRIPEIGDQAELGYIDIESKTFHKVATTNAWNFQQGALLQWFDDDSIIFNDFRDGKFCSVIKSLIDASERVLCAPLAHISADRKWGISINFMRVWDFRPGYGYCNLKDPYYNVNAPKDDGIFIVDIQANTSKLILDYQTLTKLFPEKPFCEMKILVNHITFNPSANRFLCLLRNFPEQGKRWGTILFTADRDGKNVRNLTNYEVNSHYHWKNDQEIIIFSGLPDWGIYFFNDATGERSMLDDDYVNHEDVHCLYSPDKKCFIGDCYPNTGNFRDILLYDFESKRSKMIVRAYSQPVSNTDIRCDLHNRFNRTGDVVSFDSYHAGKRQIVQFPFDREKLMNK